MYKLFQVFNVQSTNVLNAAIYFAKERVYLQRISKIYEIFSAEHWTILCKQIEFLVAVSMPLCLPIHIVFSQFGVEALRV